MKKDFNSIRLYSDLSLIAVMLTLVLFFRTSMLIYFIACVLTFILFASTSFYLVFKSFRNGVKSQKINTVLRAVSVVFVFISILNAYPAYSIHVEISEVLIKITKVLDAAQKDQLDEQFHLLFNAYGNYKNFSMTSFIAGTIPVLLSRVLYDREKYNVVEK